MCSISDVSEFMLSIQVATRHLIELGPEIALSYMQPILLLPHLLLLLRIKPLLEAIDQFM